MTNTAQFETWVEKYRDKRPKYELLASRFANLLTQLLDSRGLEVVQIDYRAKTIDSFLGKLKRKNKYAEPLTEVTDLAGIRIVTYYLEDVEEVEALVTKEFTVDREKSVIKGREAPDRFGYQSTHLIVSLGEKRRDLDEWKDLSGMQAEIQIRTATQHAWAAVEHKLGYKNPNIVDAETGRQLSRLSALFELADEQFSQVRRVTANVEKKANENVEGGDLDNLSVGVASLQAYLDSDQENMKTALAIATAGGWNVKDEPDPGDPARRERDLSDLVWTLKAMHIDTIGRFDELLSRAGEVSDQLEHIAELERNDTSGGAHPNAEAFPEDLLNILVFLLGRADPRVIETIYGGLTAEAIEDSIAEQQIVAPVRP